MMRFIFEGFLEMRGLFRLDCIRAQACEVVREGTYNRVLRRSSLVPESENRNDQDYCLPLLRGKACDRLVLPGILARRTSFPSSYPQDGALWRERGLLLRLSVALPRSVDSLARRFLLASLN